MEFPGQKSTGSPCSYLSHHKPGLVQAGKLILLENGRDGGTPDHIVEWVFEAGLRRMRLGQPGQIGRLQTLEVIDKPATRADVLKRCADGPPAGQGDEAGFRCGGQGSGRHGGHGGHGWLACVTRHTAAKHRRLGSFCAAVASTA